MVLHPGSYGDSTESLGIEKAAESINIVVELLDNTNTYILLETMAGQGRQLGYSFEQLRYMLNKIESKNTGICFDTCHVFASGYNLNNYNQTMDKFDKIIGIEKIKAFHLNDSLRDMGTRIDRHALIGEGKMGIDVFKSIVNDKRFIDVPKIIEPTDYMKDSKRQLELLFSLRNERKSQEKGQQ